jgi:DNA-binding LacI/PurR family transcriptional regulator
VATLTDEILNNPEQSAFPIASEHQLCRRFNISRVTVRLALSDLENRGLIYRKHGKGTFAHGRSTRVYRNVGVLMRSPHAAEHRPIAEIIRGLQTAQALLRAGIMLISTSPEEWRPEMASSLSGVVVLPQDVTARDLEVLRDRKLPFLIVGESPLEGPQIHLGQREAARTMTESLLDQGHRRLAMLSGFDVCLDATKRLGVRDALVAAGIDPQQVPEFSAHGEEGDIFKTSEELLKLNPRPTAVVAFDDSLVSMLRFHARRQGIVIPRDLSIVSFHDWPFLHFVEPTLNTVHFNFFEAGKQAAEALNRAALTGEAVADLVFHPTYPAGQTVGPAPH